VQKQILEILSEEELYWCKRAHSTWLLEGDNNTKFFHRVANGSKRKHIIMSLMDGDNIIEGDSDLIMHATDYYKNLFGPAPGNAFPLNVGLWENNEKVSETDNVELTKPFSETEVKEPLFQTKKKLLVLKKYLQIFTKIFGKLSKRMCWKYLRSSMLVFWM